MTNDDALALFMFFAVLIGGAVGYLFQRKRDERNNGE